MRISTESVVDTVHRRVVMPNGDMVVTGIGFGLAVKDASNPPQGAFIAVRHTFEANVFAPAVARLTISAAGPLEGLATATSKGGLPIT
jgi:hypothetical protein